jgi:hypothetical protein
VHKPVAARPIQRAMASGRASSEASECREKAKRGGTDSLQGPSSSGKKSKRLGTISPRVGLLCDQKGRNRYGYAT